jgi:DNA-binding NtrC family response regulator
VLGVSPGMQEVEGLLRRVARLTAPVLITGETGSGKEVCARFLHGIGARAAGPFMAVNCAAIPKDLMESELFGHERGAFTGASSRHRGYAERAGIGTLFLDEIGDLDLKLQAKLLRLIEDRTFHRIGGEEGVPFKARLVCATNADLEVRTKAGLFREDLFYRVNVLSVSVPPLRSRADDIEWLANRFFDEFTTAQDTKLRGLSALAAEALHDHRWPGNVRELRNRVERAVALALGQWIMPADLFRNSGTKSSTASRSFCRSPPFGMQPSGARSSGRLDRVTARSPRLQPASAFRAPPCGRRCAATASR